MNHLPVSVMMFVHEEHARLRESLKSVEWAAEILIFDNASGITWESVRDIPSQVKIFDWPEPMDDFAAARNRAAMECSQPWIFVLDSDEVVVEIELETMRSQLADQSIVALAIRRSDVFAGKPLQYGEAGNQQLLRLYRAGRGTWRGRVHEVLVVENAAVATSMKIYHYAHASVSSFITDVHDYAKRIGTAKAYQPIRTELELLFLPPGKFLMNIVVRGGSMDGWRGLVYAWCMSLHSLLVRIYQIEAHLKQTS